jgi:hypothetical protein
MSSIYIRFAEDADNEKIMGLAKRCPQEGMITFFPNRTPQFNTLHQILDPSAWHLVACKDNQIVGLVGVIHFNAKVLGNNCKIGYMLDLRVDKDYRSGTTAYKLIKAAADNLQQSDLDMVIANFLKDNKRPLVFTSGRGGLPNAHYMGDNKIFNILPIRFMQLNSRFEINELIEEDIPEIIELYRKHAANAKISPIITEELFKKYISSVEGLSFSNFLIAKENGKIKAITAFWDEHKYKSYQVLKFNFSIKVATNILKFLSLFMRVPRPIRLNEPLRQLTLVMHAHDNCPEALDTLFRHINNINIGSDYTLIMLYAQESDPIFRFMKKYIGVTVKSEMYIFARDNSLFEKLDSDTSSVQFDLTMTL